MVWYAPGLSEADAKRLGNVLLELGVYDDAGTRTARLRRDGPVWVVTLEGIDPRPEKAPAKKLVGIARQISENVFGGASVRLMLDSAFDPAIEVETHHAD